MSLQWLGFVGAAIAVLATVGYVASILRGYSRPHRVTWGVWALISLLGFASAESAGAGAGALVALAFLIGQSVIFALSLFPQYGKQGGRRYDKWLGLAAVSTLSAWYVLDLDPLVAAAVAVAVDAVAAWPTLREAWHQPQTESAAVWGIDALAAGLGVVAIRDWNPAAAAYPLYLLLATGSVAAILVVRTGATRPARYP